MSRQRRKERQVGLTVTLAQQESELQKTQQHAQVLEAKLAALQAKMSAADTQQQPNVQQQQQQQTEMPTQQQRMRPAERFPGSVNDSLGGASAAFGAIDDAALDGGLECCSSIASIQAFVRKHKLLQLLSTGEGL